MNTEEKTTLAYFQYPKPVTNKF